MHKCATQTEVNMQALIAIYQKKKLSHKGFIYPQKIDEDEYYYGGWQIRTERPIIFTLCQSYKFNVYHPN